MVVGGGWLVADPATGDGGARSSGGELLVGRTRAFSRADKLLLRNWPCNPVCSPCNQEPETANHLILHCTFARQVWELLGQWTGNLIQVPAPGLEVEGWWECGLAQLPKKTRRLKPAIMIYGAWNIWVDFRPEACNSVGGPARNKSGSKLQDASLRRTCNF